FLWRDMPGADLPPGWYGPEALAALPLSSKSHWDLPFELPGATRSRGDTPQLLHFLVSHPTPPGFDGPEDRNGRRNQDEIRLWADYLTPGKGGYLVDDAGRRGPLAPDASFVIAGDLNADPDDGDSRREGERGGAIRQLLQHPRVHPEVALGGLVPRSAGAAEAAVRQGGANAAHRGPAAQDTADFSDGGPNSPGNLRVDYVLPSAGLEVCATGVYWPTADDPAFALVNDDAEASSDHRLVWVDIALSGTRCPQRR
ncbi:MAG: endonuclease/exonuclease/phosphatase family protein, partial [Gammaproteobacteria bacterium]